MTYAHKAVSWQDFLCYETVFPEHTARAKIEIEHFLGYLPAPEVTLPFEPYLRVLVHQAKAGILDNQEYDKLTEQHVRLIRNFEYRHHLMPDYDHQLYQRYQMEYLSHGAIARARIVSLLGYEPELSRSLVAELYLRQLMQRDDVNLPKDKITSFDFKVLGLIRYRECVITRGTAAADNLPCLRCDPGLHET